jgi:hypothetical protein
MFNIVVIGYKLELTGVCFNYFVIKFFDFANFFFFEIIFYPWKRKKGGGTEFLIYAYEGRNV